MAAVLMTAWLTRLRSRSCRCGHPRSAHDHYRPGSDCGLCECGEFRRG